MYQFQYEKMGYEWIRGLLDAPDHPPNDLDVHMIHIGVKKAKKNISYFHIFSPWKNRSTLRVVMHRQWKYR
jgi:hypothetical protein